MSKYSINGVPTKRSTPTLPARLVRNEVQDYLLTRSLLGRRTQGDPCGRDLNKECGYPTAPLTAKDYYDLFEKEGLASRTVGVHADECWSVYPELYETEDRKLTEFETQWIELVETPGLNPWHYLHRADVHSGIGRCGIMLLGVNDGRGLDQPLEGADLPRGKYSSTKRELLYLRVFSENHFEVDAYERNPTNPRFGQPTMYSVTVYEPTTADLGQPPPTPGKAAGETTLKLHWSRVVHLADNRTSSEIFGLPRLRQPLHRIYDLRKVLGGSSEMFWKGAFPGYSFETFPDIDSEIDKASLLKQIEAYHLGLQRYLALEGMTAKSLAPQVADPTKHYETLVSALCATIKVPVRIFLGSESGHLASTQDSVAWNRRLGHRQTAYLNPMVVLPFVERLQKVGVLVPTKKLQVAWKDLNSMSDKDKSDVAMKVTQSLLQYVTSGAEKVMPLWQYLTLVLKFTDSEAQSVLDAAQKQTETDELTKDVWMQQTGVDTASGSSTAPEKATGATGRRNAVSKGA